jgi:hypothetical protein
MIACKTTKANEKQKNIDKIVNILIDLREIELSKLANNYENTEFIYSDLVLRLVPVFQKKESVMDITKLPYRYIALNDLIKIIKAKLKIYKHHLDILIIEQNILLNNDGVITQVCINTNLELQANNKVIIYELEKILLNTSDE